MEAKRDSEVVIIGAGPAGLTAGYELARHGRSCTVLEGLGQVGGLSRTEEYRGFRFDIGGHRFFTRVAVVEKMWREVLGSEFLVRPRLSRIYYRKRFFPYPLDPLDTLLGLGLVESARCMLSYVWAQCSRSGRGAADLESWLVARFGRRLYETFFKTYTEKVWGRPCHTIGADWAAQRIRGLSLATLVRETLAALVRGPSAKIKTLIQEFDYPRLGPGQMWERTQRYLEDKGSRILLERPVTKIRWGSEGATAIEAAGETYGLDQLLSTMPVRDFVRMLDPVAPEEVVRAAGALEYRDFITVALVIGEAELFPDNWIYVHEPDVKVGRIQNYKNWSPDMVPDAELTCLGLEYFCFEGDDLWTASDEALLERGRRELAQLGLCTPEKVIDGKVLRVPKAYPVYDQRYQESLRVIREFLAARLPNVQFIGRNGMHRYNNQDHSMLTGMLAARNILGLGPFDLWAVNADEEYHEDGFRLSAKEIADLEASQPSVPAPNEA